MRFVYGSTLMLLLSWAGGGSALGAQAARRPNIIFLLTDDQRFDAIGYRNDILKTPHMDRLAASGVDFGNAFVTTSICAASRASLFTGLVERT